MNGICLSNTATRRALTALGLPIAAAGVLLVAPGASAASEHHVSAGSMTWGVKQSFRTYLDSPVAQGKSEPLEGATKAADGAFIFPKATGVVADGGVTSVNFQGAVHFTGHEGVLDFSLANPKLRLNALGKGTLEVTMKEAGGASSDVVIADLSGAPAQVKGGELSINSLKATLTEAGTKVFSYRGHGFYPAGTVMDPVSVSATLADEGSSTPAPTSTAPASTSAAPVPTSTTPAPTSTAPVPTSTTPTPTSTVPTSTTPAPTATSTAASTVPAPTGSTSTPGAPASTSGPKVDTDYVQAGSSSDEALALIGGAGVLALAGGAAWARRSQMR